MKESEKYLERKLFAEDWGEGTIVIPLMDAKEYTRLCVKEQMEAKIKELEGKKIDIRYKFGKDYIDVISHNKGINTAIKTLKA